MMSLNDLTGVAEVAMQSIHAARTIKKRVESGAEPSLSSTATSAA